MTDRLRQRSAAWISAVAIATVLWPIADNLRADPVDGFPLTHYPMFTADRGRTMTVTYLVGVDDEGAKRPLTYRLAGTGGLNQVRKQIRRLVLDDRADELCQQVASRVARRTGASYRRLRAVNVVSGRYDFRSYFRGDTEPEREEVHAACAVPERTR